MEPVIRPEPTPEERAAILAALERLLSENAGPPAYRSAWRDMGVRENLDDSAREGDYGATVRPRRSPGASRA
jgi:hypothetical protein